MSIVNTSILLEMNGTEIESEICKLARMLGEYEVNRKNMNDVNFLV